MNPICKFQDGKLYEPHAGKYVEDEFGSSIMGRLYTLKHVPLEYRTHQDNRFIQEIQDALKERRDWEEKNG